MNEAVGDSTPKGKPAGESFREELGGDWGPAKESGSSLVPSTIAESRERTRKWIAYWLIVILAGDILVGVSLIVFQKAIGTAGSEAKDFMSMTLAPIVALLGAVTGFYYGGKHSD